jgi:hypothetical protein
MTNAGRANVRRPASDFGVKSWPKRVSSWAGRSTVTMPRGRVHVAALEPEQLAAAHARETSKKHEGTAASGCSVRE